MIANAEYITANGTLVKTFLPLGNWNKWAAKTIKNYRAITKVGCDSFVATEYYKVVLNDRMVDVWFHRQKVGRGYGAWPLTRNEAAASALTPEALADFSLALLEIELLKGLLNK